MATITIATARSLPRDIDVKINVSKAQAETLTDLTTLVFCTPDANFPQNASRLQLYSSLDAVGAAFAVSSEAYKAAASFFSQSPRPSRMAIARVFQDPVAGYLQTGMIGDDLEVWKGVVNGSFQVSIDGTMQQITNINFGTITNLEDVAAVVQTAIRGVSGASTGFTNATVKLLSNGTINIISGTTGDQSTVSLLSAIAPANGTDISGVGFLNGAMVDDAAIQEAYVVNGYTPEGLASEVNLIRQASWAADIFLYGWTFDKTFRDSQELIQTAQMLEGQKAICGITTNSPFAYDASSTSDIGYQLMTLGLTRTFVTYHDNPYYYPEVAALAIGLSVDYNGTDTTLTMKFKNLNGIPTVKVTETQLEVLNGKNVNTFTLVGNDARTYREGVESAPSWYIDERINLDNFAESLQVSVYNIFLQNKKVPYTTDGITLLQNAIIRVCNQYVRNGTFADRPMEATEAGNGVNISPAYRIVMQELSAIGTAQRASRIGPTTQIICNLSGAIHSITLNVETIS